MDYIVGVDAGGTTTTAAAFDLQGCELARQMGGFGNITVDLTQGTANIIATIEALMAGLPGRCIFLCLGVAGVETGERKAYMRAELEARFDCELSLLNDGQIALLALFQGGDGVLCIAGTGSIALGKRGGEYLRCGGYGTVLSDEGSAYSIAVDALKTVVRAYDKGEAPDALAQGLQQAAGAKTMHDYVELVTSGSKAQVAALSRAVTAAYDAGSESARAVLERAGCALADMVAIVARRMGEAAVPVALSGSILKNVPYVRECFAFHLSLLAPGAAILQEDAFVPAGAYYRYIELHGKQA